MGVCVRGGRSWGVWGLGVGGWTMGGDFNFCLAIQRASLKIPPIPQQFTVSPWELAYGIGNNSLQSPVRLWSLWKEENAYLNITESTFKK